MSHRNHAPRRSRSNRAVQNVGVLCRLSFGLLVSFALLGACGCSEDDGVQQSPDAAIDGVADSNGCEDPGLAAAYETCLQSHTETACAAAGGAWIAMPAGGQACNCPTGQQDCTCVSTSPCLHFCLAERPPGGSCDGVTEGHCSPRSLLFGDYCAYVEDKGFMPYSFH